jgi:hypothetical protein
VEINITINAGSDKPEVKIDEKKTPSFKLMKSKTKLGQTTVLRMPPMMEDHTPQRMGILQNLGI